MSTPSTTTKRRRMLGMLLALASAVSIAGLQPRTASADTLYGPTGTPDGRAHWHWRDFGFGLAGYLCFGLGYISYMTFVVAWMRGRGAGAAMY